MTREEILAMKPGRELDALVAKTMGWTDVAYRLGGRYESHKDEWPVEYVGWFGKPPGWNGSADDLLPEVPYYSAEIAAAWEVVEMLQKENPFWMESGEEAFLAFQLAPTRPLGWMVNFGDDTTVAYGATVPEAICKAAILATLEEQPMG